MHYLDNSATTQVCPEAAQAALLAMTEVYGNPSSTHILGREAKKLLDKSRKQVAEALGCVPGELVFTSCGSESDNWAILGGAEAMKRRGKHVISSLVEHDAVRRSLDELEARGFEVTRLQPERDGSVSVQAVLDALREDTVLVTLMLVPEGFPRPAQLQFGKPQPLFRLRFRRPSPRARRLRILCEAVPIGLRQTPRSRLR